MKKIVKHLNFNPSLGILVTKRYTNSIKMPVNKDVKFDKTEQLSSQIGSIIFTQDESGMANFLTVSSRKSRLVGRSVIGNEIFAFAEAVDFTILIRYDLQQMLKSDINLQVLANSPSLFDMTMKSSTTPKKYSR